MRRVAGCRRRKRGRRVGSTVRMSLPEKRHAWRLARESGAAAAALALDGLKTACSLSATTAARMNSTVLHSLPLVSFPAGHDVITQDQPLSGLYFLESGEIAVLRNGVLVAEIFEPGAVVGEMSWLLGTTPTATVRTLVPCSFRQLADPEDFLRKNPDFTLQIAATLARRIDSLNRYLVDIKNQFRDQAGHLGIIDEVLDSLMHKHPRNIPRRETGD
ncbi:MAG: Crp/Fnr family transcriptional regulator [Opitutus sp.]|nr:Crp/Fnr family transcriptional regulator [Opitutus sp.]MSU51541.1 Crp/Fnr family transcriptional regulator [Opitutus sp.]